MTETRLQAYGISLSHRDWGAGMPLFQEGVSPNSLFMNRPLLLGSIGRGLADRCQPLT